MKTKKIYKAIAKQHGVSVSEVKRDMQAAIDEAYKNPNAAALDIPKKGTVPNVDEFLDYTIETIHKDEQK